MKTCNCEDYPCCIHGEEYDSDPEECYHGYYDEFEVLDDFDDEE